MTKEETREYARKYQKRIRKENPKKVNLETYQRVLAWRQKYPEKRRAQKMIEYQIKIGRIKRRKCFCGKKGEAHHEDYSKPLEITWVCRTHHMELHRKY